ncbi:ATP-binding protein [Pseudomonas sp. 5P_5.1_Bac1]|uniref:ATP-binding protein n=1 Tax=Pseudomonas sp. 5P_5.1_Bac1 TaxID=2971616 RepID=UPI0021C8C233|nr:ATP-binding protein [Pseudomonas sp. 5P_5.1_Bac1]MCU1720226.1 ATP-binding protein [Pseudomonas sp. 5P_5.1_Bac1]
MESSHQLKVQSHILRLLGDQLIGHDRLAVFELVKNSYDADASLVSVTLSLFEDPPKIIVEDNGSGMSFDTIVNAWLEVGTDSKRSEFGKKRSPIFNRSPLGEKGVGRLAVQKLGKHLKIVTREHPGNEVEFSINWDTLISSSKYLDKNIKVKVKQNTQPKYFKNSSGTRIEITDLHNNEWSRRDLRELYRLVKSLSNPFLTNDSFDVNLNLPGRESDIEDLPDIGELLHTATWKFSFKINKDGILRFAYIFNPPNFKRLKGHAKRYTGKLELAPEDKNELSTAAAAKRDKHIFLSPEELKGIGPISGRIYAFNQRSEILKLLGNSQLLKNWLITQSGVRVYRDNIRVFNYGEPGDDWLRLNTRRINTPGGKFGTNSIVSYVNLDLQQSNHLKEKTNREGFDENEYYKKLRRITLSVFEKFERQHTDDRKTLDIAIKGEEKIPPLEEALESIKKTATKHKIQKEIEPALKSIKLELDNYRQVMASSGVAAMNINLAFHEMVHGVDKIVYQLEKNVNPEAIQKTVNHLRSLLDTFKPLLKREKNKSIPAEELVKRVLKLHEHRFPRHDVVVSNWLADIEKSINFNLKGPINLMLGALGNIVDNAIYWSRYRKERDSSPLSAAILILSSWDPETKEGQIAVIDNGPGFQLPEESIGKPFATTKSGGMGLGIYYARLVMESMQGNLLVCSADDLRDDFKFSKNYDGAAIVLQFKE